MVTLPYTTRAAIPMLNFLHAVLIADTHRELRYRSALILYFLAVVIGCIPGARADAAEIASGVVLHSTAYAGLTFLLFSATLGTPLRRAVLSVLSIAVMGAFDEFVQSHFPYRHGAVSDWVVDCSAALVMAVLLLSCWAKVAPARQAGDGTIR